MHGHTNVKRYKYTFRISLHPRFVKTAQQATSRQAPSRSTDQDISSLLSTNYTAASTLGPRAHIQCVSFTLALLTVMYGWMKALYVIICCDRRDDKPEIPYYWLIKCDFSLYTPQRHITVGTAALSLYVGTNQFNFTSHLRPRSPTFRFPSKFLYHFLYLRLPRLLFLISLHLIVILQYTDEQLTHFLGMQFYLDSYYFLAGLSKITFRIWTQITPIYFPTLQTKICNFISRYHTSYTGHLDTGFSWLSCVYKWMLR
jgi:hypothetical protein